MQVEIDSYLIDIQLDEEFVNEPGPIVFNFTYLCPFKKYTGMARFDHLCGDPLESMKGYLLVSKPTAVIGAERMVINFPATFASRVREVVLISSIHDEVVMLRDEVERLHDAEEEARLLHEEVKRLRICKIKSTMKIAALEGKLERLEAGEGSLCVNCLDCIDMV